MAKQSTWGVRFQVLRILEKYLSLTAYDSETQSVGLRGQGLGVGVVVGELSLRRPGTAGVPGVVTPGEPGVIETGLPAESGSGFTDNDNGSGVG